MQRLMTETQVGREKGRRTFHLFPECPLAHGKLVAISGEVTAAPCAWCHKRKDQR